MIVIIKKKLQALCLQIAHFYTFYSNALFYRYPVTYLVQIHAGGGTHRKMGKEGLPCCRNYRRTHPVGRRRQSRLTVLLPETTEDRKKSIV